MRLEYALSIGAPRSAMLQAIQSHSTGPSHRCIGGAGVGAEI